MDEFLDRVFPNWETLEMDQMADRVLAERSYCLLVHIAQQLEEREKQQMASIDELTTEVNNYQSAVHAKLAADQQIITTDTKQIADLQNAVVPDALVQQFKDATAALNAPASGAANP
jgi:hypothetical protein